MRKVYLDRTESGECFALFSKDVEIVFAGTTISSMPQSDYNEEYRKFEENYDIKFVFDGFSPQIDFYAVPQFDVFATDSDGGYIGTIGSTSDFESDYPIGYIDRDGSCFLIAAGNKAFLKNVNSCKADKREYDGIQIFSCKEEALNHLEFNKIAKLDSFDQ